MLTLGTVKEGDEESRRRALLVQEGARLLLLKSETQTAFRPRMRMIDQQISRPYTVARPPDLHAES